MSNRQSGKSSPRLAPYTSCVSSPRYRSDLYSESWLGRSNANGSETRPAGSRRTKSSPELCLCCQTGVSMRCITSWMLTCYSNFTTKSRQSFAGSSDTSFVPNKKDCYTGFVSIASYFSVPSLRRKIEQVKNSSQTLSSCVTSFMKAFLNSNFHPFLFNRQVHADFLLNISLP